MTNRVNIQNIYLETPQVIKYKNILLIACASILPLYLSMFRYHLFGATIRIADFVCLFAIFFTLIFFPKYFLKFIQFKFLPMWFLLAYIIIQGIFLNNTAASIKEAIQLLWVCTYLGIASVYAQWDSRKFYKWTLIFLALSAGYTILYHLSIGHISRYKLASDGKYAFGLLSVLLLLKANNSNLKQDKLLLYLSLIPLLLSLERKGILGVFFIWFLLELIKIFKSKPTLKGIPIFLGGAFILFIPSLLNEFGLFIDKQIYNSYSLDETVALYTSNMHRESLLINSYQIIRDNLFFGVGADKIMEYMGQFYVHDNLRNGAHNFYVDTLVKYGVVGTSLLLCWPVLITFYHKVLHQLPTALIMFHIYCIFVITFMADGQAVLIVFLFSFLNPYLFADYD